MKRFLIIILFVMAAGVGFSQTAVPPADYGILYPYNDSLQYETYPHANGWGYRLYHRYQLVIEQPMIPAISGQKGFKNQVDARKIARLAMSKLAKNRQLPTISVEEIKKLLKIKVKQSLR